LNRLQQAHNELAETLGATDAAADVPQSAGPNEGANDRVDARLAVEPTFLHFRLDLGRAQVVQERLIALLTDLEREPPDPDGQVYGVCVAMFVAPPYLQVSDPPSGTAEEGEARHAAPQRAQEEDS